MPSSVIFESNNKHWVFIGEDEEGKVAYPAVPSREVGRYREEIDILKNNLWECLDDKDAYDPENGVFEHDLVCYNYVTGKYDPSLGIQDSFKTLIEAMPGAAKLKNPILFELYID